MKKTPLYMAIGAIVLPAMYTYADTNTSDIISCQFPTDVPAPDAGQAAFDKYSWRMFTALNYPVGEKRGRPDCNKSPGSSSDTVWRSYKQRGEIFLDNGSKPEPWNSYNEQMLSLEAISKVSESTEKAIDQPVGGWLIDRHGNPTYYQIMANRKFYNYVVKNTLYNSEGIKNFDKPIRLTDNSVVLKASWRIMTDADDQSHYLTTSAKVATYNDKGEPGLPEEAVLGLVGLHLISKAPGYPQWIWSTFEHVDNVPDEKDRARKGKKYSYYNPDRPLDNLNQSPCDYNEKHQCIPKKDVSFHTPDQLSRLTSIADDTRKVNKYAQGVLSNAGFMPYYQLVTTQRPKYPNDPGDPGGTPTPALSANTTMESYIQTSSSCMECHRTAVTPVEGKAAMRADYSFMFMHAQPEQKQSDNN